MTSSAGSPRQAVSRLLRAVQLLVAVLLVGAGVLALVPAPTYDLWAVAVVASVYGHGFLIAVAAHLVPGVRRGRVGRLSLVLCAAAAVCAVAPAEESWRRAEERGAGLVCAEASRLRDISLSTLFFGSPTPAVQPRTWTFDDRLGLTLDVYLPNMPPAPLPTLVVVHGGAWQGSDRHEFSALNSYLAARGMAVVTIDYRLAPQWPFPAALTDVETALRFLRDRHVALGLASDRVVLMGRSAGGHLALLAAYRAALGSVDGVISYYAPTDLVWGYEHPRNPLVIDSREVLRTFLGKSLEGAQDLYRRASPVTWARPGLPPTLLVHGDRDDQVSPRQATLLYDALIAAGAPAAQLQLAMANHTFDYNFNGVQAQIATNAIEDFLHKLPAARSPLPDRPDR